MALSPQEPLGSRMLGDVREGMAVVDRNGKDIGTVDRVYLGSSSEAAMASGTGAATGRDPDDPEPSLVRLLSDVVAPTDRMPRELRQRLLRQGFLRIDSAGLFAADRYVLPDQIADVAETEVRLAVAREDLIKR